MSISIVVPIYTDNLSEYEYLSLDRMKHVFQKRHFSIVCPDNLNEFIKKTFSDVSFTIINFPNKMFKNNRSYNRLLMSIEFYQQFQQFSHILICQLDVYVFCDQLDCWIEKGYDFIGAPTFEGYHKGNRTEFKISLNGGLSLRSVSSAINILKSLRLRYMSIRLLAVMEKNIKLRLIRIIRDGLVFNYHIPLLNPVINEDLFWTYIVPHQNKEFRIPSSNIARTFSFDVNPRFLFEENNGEKPMGIHAWWRYDVDFAWELINK